MTGKRTKEEQINRQRSHFYRDNVGVIVLCGGESGRVSEESEALSGRI